MQKQSPLTEDIKTALAEFLGTLFFIFLSLTCVQVTVGGTHDLFTNMTTNDQMLTFFLHQKSILLSIAAAFGFGLAVCIAFTAPISGGHLNPAVTISFLALGEIKPLRALFYIVAQCLGATAGAAFARLVSGYSVLYGVNAPATGISEISAVCCEALLTFVLVYTVLTTAVDATVSKGLAPLYIGLSVFVIHISSVFIDGTSVNPARSFGASLVAGKWDSHWVFWVGPVVGGLVASGFWKLFKSI
ncbi:major intrinsic protein [Gorgonomyces haynaldii]|nr:major intrinsic protein [Gorgonomyces haynaldii]